MRTSDHENEVDVPVDVVDYVRAVLRAWWVVLLCAVLGLGLGAYRNHSTPAVYSSQVTFYISTPTDSSSSAFTTDQFAQSRANSYALLLSSERVAQLVASSTPLGLTARQLMGEIHASVPLNTVLLTATVNDSSPARALRITTALAAQFGPFVDLLDNTGKTPVVSLSVVSGPLGSTHAISPKTHVNLVLGLLGGLVVGLVCAVALDIRRRTHHHGGRRVTTGPGGNAHPGLPTMSASADEPTRALAGK